MMTMGLWMHRVVGGYSASISPNPATGEVTSYGGFPEIAYAGATCTGSGGTVQSYSWTQLSGNSMGITGATSSSPTWSSDSGWLEIHISATWRCTVTFVGGATASATVDVYLDRYNDL